MAAGGWRSGIPEIVIVAGCVLATAGNLLALTSLLGALPGGWVGPVGAHLLGLSLSAVPPVLLLARRERRPRHFVLLAVVSTPVALLTLGGLPGGVVALGGAVWGLLATYEPLPERG